MESLAMPLLRALALIPLSCLITYSDSLAPALLTFIAADCFIYYQNTYAAYTKEGQRRLERKRTEGERGRRMWVGNEV